MKEPQYGQADMVPSHEIIELLARSIEDGDLGAAHGAEIVSQGDESLRFRLNATGQTVSLEITRNKPRKPD